MKQFDPETLEVPNGEPTTVYKKTRAAKKTGDYEIQIELELGGERANSGIKYRFEACPRLPDHPAEAGRRAGGMSAQNRGLQAAQKGN